MEPSLIHYKLAPRSCYNTTMNSDNNDPKTINSDDQNTMADAGVDIAGGSGENIAEGEKEEVPEVMDIDSSADEATAEKAGIKFVQTDKTDLSGMAEAKQKAVSDSKALEAEFKAEFPDFKGSLKPESENAVMGKVSSLSALLTKIQEKLGFKKTSVREELGSLKKMKDAIGKDIEEIKKLESSEQKIKEEIGKIESIRKEVEDIEEKLGEDLK